MRTASESLTGCIAAALCGLAAVLATAMFAGCAAPASTPAPDPNAGLLRDFLDGKFDAAGHPLNARVTQGSALCTGAGALAATCTAALPGAEQAGDLIVNLHLQVTAHADAGDIVTLALAGADGTTLATDTLTVARLRGDSWLDLPLTWNSSGAAVTLRVAPAAGAVVDLDYVEVFPQRFGLVASPGSGVIADTDHVTFELPLDKTIDRITADGVDVSAALAGATTTSTDFRTLIDIAVGDLAPMRGDVTQLMLAAGDDAARVELRRAPPPCAFDGDPGGKKVLVTGFQPFPANAYHDNVSGVAVTALDVSTLNGAQVMRLVLPVEYDRAAAEVTDAIARCAPDAVISFGQGGDAIALEEVGYNLQDTGEVAGGVPDNRGIIRAAQPIDPAAPATRPTLLPLAAIEAAIVALGEAPQHSTDPGRYICNNVMFADLGAMAGRGAAGFIHLPYTDQFDDTVRARFGKVVAAAVQATVDHL